MAADTILQSTEEESSPTVVDGVAVDGMAVDGTVVAGAAGGGMAADGTVGGGTARNGAVVRRSPAGMAQAEPSQRTSGDSPSAARPGKRRVHDAPPWPLGFRPDHRPVGMPRRMSRERQRDGQPDSERRHA